MELLGQRAVLFAHPYRKYGDVGHATSARCPAAIVKPSGSPTAILVGKRGWEHLTSKYE